ncbi:hypothetical protein PInf_007901 [Phytophthora infestans]|nr:hypothetical protein PInf_007901 [Phytophthora infestans]
MATSYNPQYIVLGTDGTVVEADPSLYFQSGSNQPYQHRDQDQFEKSQNLSISQNHRNLKSFRGTKRLAETDLDIFNKEADDDEFSATTASQETAASVSRSTLALINDGVPGVYGSVVFAELPHHENHLSGNGANHHDIIYGSRKDLPRPLHYDSSTVKKIFTLAELIPPPHTRQIQLTGAGV